MRVLIFICCLAIHSLGIAEQPVFAVDGAAVRGVDVVAYFTDQQMVAGKPEHSYQWSGVTWYFSSPQNLELFRSDPLQYAPQFGGFGSLTIAHGAAIPPNPGAWAIHDGRLYLFVFPAAKETWLMNAEQLIQRAQAQWSKVGKHQSSN